MLWPVDIALLLRLTLPGASSLPYRKLAADMRLSASEVHASVKRAKLSGLISHVAPKTPNRSALLEFLGSGFRYAFPAERGSLTRGLPTAYAAVPLNKLIAQGDDPPPVWPSPRGKVRGYALMPLYKHAVSAAEADAKFYELLALADALRDGRARERKIAIDLMAQAISE